MRERNGGRYFSTERPGRNFLKKLLKDEAFPLWSDVPSEGMRQSAVLVPLFPSGDALRILFLRRLPHLSRHGGEICFPGGMKEPDDESPLRTALREAEEETGIPPETVEPLLLLPLEYTVVSDVVVFPVLGVVSRVDPEKDLVLSPSEIAAAYTVDMSLFPMEPRRKELIVPSLPTVVSYPEYDLSDGSIVWGVTARILERVLCLL